MKSCTAAVEHDPVTGLYAGFVPGFPGAHSQGQTLDELDANLRDVIAMLLEDGEPAQVVAILLKLGLPWFASGARTSSIAMPPGAVRRCHATPGRDLSPALLRQITRDIGSSIDELVAYR